MSTDHERTEGRATPEPHEPFTRGRSSLLTQVTRTNHPEGIDLSAFTSAHRDTLSRSALWLAAEVKDMRSLEMVIGPRSFKQTEQEVLLRIMLSVFLSEINDVLRNVEAQQKAEAADEAAAF